MYIHTVNNGETLYHIARKYGTSAVKIAENNGLTNPDELSVGQKLLILTPTRIYTVRGGDTLDKISGRFGISKRILYQNNPCLMGCDKVRPQTQLALKYDTPTHGAIPVNGYYFKGCGEEKIKFALPYLNYLTISAYKSEYGRLAQLFDDIGAINLARENKKIPIMRIYDNRTLGDILCNLEDFCDKISDIASRRGYKGITLAAYNSSREEGYDELLFKIKKRLIEEGLFLFTEIDANIPYKPEDISDGSILLYEKCHLKDIPSFEEGERRAYTEYAEVGDAGKTFIDFSPFAHAKESPITKNEATRLAYKARRQISYDPERHICKFEYKEFSSPSKENLSICFDSPENTKAKLDLLSKLGFMGISFDIMRIPTYEIMMMNACYSLGMDYLSSSAEI